MCALRPWFLCRGRLRPRRRRRGRVAAAAPATKARAQDLETLAARAVVAICRAWVGSVTSQCHRVQACVCVSDERRSGHDVTMVLPVLQPLAASGFNRSASVASYTFGDLAQPLVTDIGRQVQMPGRRSHELSRACWSRWPHGQVARGYMEGGWRGCGVDKLSRIVLLSLFVASRCSLHPLPRPAKSSPMPVKVTHHPPDRKRPTTPTYREVSVQQQSCGTA